MVKKIIFFITSPLDQRDFNRYGAPVLIRNGFEVIFLDFTPFVNPLLEKRITICGPITYQRNHRFYNKKEAFSAISKLTIDSFVVVMANYNKKTFGLYYSLSKTKIPFAVFCLPALPFNILENQNTSNFLKKALYKIKNLPLPELAKLLINYPFRPSFSEYLGIRMPRFWIAGGTKSVDYYLTTNPFGKNTEIIWSHTLDYDIYLENRDGVISSQHNNKAVFIDFGVPRFLGGCLAENKCHHVLTEEKYYPSLCRFFDRVEKEQGVKIEIAAHPQTKHQAHPDYFGHRLTVLGKTCQMIKEAKFVIAHSSTALNFANLFKKPVIFITTDQLESNINNEGIHIMTMAFWFGKKPINIDQQFRIDWDKELTIHEASYSNYKNCYIKSEGTEEISSWQIFSNRLKLCR